MSPQDFISKNPVADQRKLALSTELAQVVHEDLAVGMDESREMQHAILLMSTIHSAMRGMDQHLNGISRETFMPFAGILTDYLCDNAAMEFPEVAESTMEIMIEVLEENLAMFRSTMKASEK